MPADSNSNGDIRRAAQQRALAPDLGLRPGVGHSAGKIVRTAISFEPHDGHLFVFMPPTGAAEDCSTSSRRSRRREELRQPVIIEAIRRRFRPRLKSFSVTPGPGVVEVDIHPSMNWRELVDKTRSSTRNATTRLGAQKFMNDGRHTGTSSSNHVTLGGHRPPIRRCCAGPTC